jgi:fused signal recognition particle receptor
MNRLYLILPLVLIGCFGAAYRFQIEDNRAQAQSLAADAELAAQKAAAEQKVLERKAQTDAEQRLASRLAEEKKQETERQALWDADERRIEGELSAAKVAVAASEAEITALEQKRDALVATQARLRRESFELEKVAEQAKISEHNAETEVQRLAEIVAGKAAATPHPSISP